MTDQDAGAWRTLSLTVEEVRGPMPITVAMFVLPAPLALELERQMALMNDVVDVETVDMEKPPA